MEKLNPQLKQSNTTGCQTNGACEPAHLSGSTSSSRGASSEMGSDTAAMPSPGAAASLIAALSKRGFMLTRSAAGRACAALCAYGATAGAGALRHAMLALLRAEAAPGAQRSMLRPVMAHVVRAPDDSCVREGGRRLAGAGIKNFDCLIQNFDPKF